jgi:hypothetical protein
MEKVDYGFNDYSWHKTIVAIDFWLLRYNFWATPYHRIAAFTLFIWCPDENDDSWIVSEGICDFRMEDVRHFLVSL